MSATFSELMQKLPEIQKMEISTTEEQHCVFIVMLELTQAMWRAVGNGYINDARAKAGGGE